MQRDRLLLAENYPFSNPVSWLDLLLIAWDFYFVSLQLGLLWARNSLRDTLVKKLSKQLQIQ